MQLRTVPGSITEPLFKQRGGGVDPEKISIIRGEREPSTTTELRNFLSFAGYYCRSIPRFAVMSATLHKATTTKRNYKWTYEIRKAFEGLKITLISPPVLVFPDFEQPFVVETDSSSVAVGPVLPQRMEARRVHPIHYASHTMTSAERKYSAYDREALAVIFALKRFEPTNSRLRALRLSLTIKRCSTPLRRTISTGN